MKKYQYFNELSRFSAKQVSRLEHKLRAASERIGKTQIESNLDEADFAGSNLSFGLYDKHRLVAYVLAFIGDQVISIQDIAILPAYSSQLRSLITRLDQKIYAQGEGLAIEFRAATKTRKRLVALRYMPKHFHYRLVTPRDADSKSVLRWEMEPAVRHLAVSPLPLPEPIWRCEVEGDPMEVLHVRDPRQWLPLREDWNRLLKATFDHTVFQTFEHLWIWWKYFGFSHTLCVLVFRRAGETVALAPFMETCDFILGGCSQSISFVAAANLERAQCLADGPNGPYFHAALSYLFEHPDLWDYCDFAEQRKDFPLTTEIKARFVEQNCFIAELDDSKLNGYAYIELNGSWDAFRAALSPKMRNNLSRSERLLAKRGAVSLETINTWPELDEALLIYRRVERRSWKPAKSLGFGVDPAHTEYYRSLARHFGMDGCFTVRLLKVGEEYVAGTFGIFYNGIFYSMMTAFDQNHARSSPGTYLEGLELEDCFQLGVREYDPLSGFLHQKTRWTSTVRYTVDQLFYQRKPRIALYYFAFFVFKPTLRALLIKLRLFKLALRCLKWVRAIRDRYRDRFFPTQEVRRTHKDFFPNDET